MNFLMALHMGSKFVDDAASGSRPVNAARIADAIGQTKPTVVSLAVVLWQQMARLLVDGLIDPTSLRSIRVAGWGGAQLSSELASVLLSYELPLIATYGQTETCGYALAGRLGEAHAHAAMTPLSADVRYRLDEIAPDDESQAGLSRPADTGELVLIGHRGVRRSGSLGTAGEEAEAISTGYSTGDLFTHVLVAGKRMLTHVCRADDVLAHTSGEMTNPLPIEAMLMDQCGHIVSCVCVIGQGLPRPVLVTELLHGSSLTPPVAAALRCAIVDANRMSPAYSSLLPEQVIVLTPPLHEPLARTAKGNVKRGLTHRRFAHQLVRWFGDAGLSSHGFRLSEEASCILGCSVERADISSGLGAVPGGSLDSLQVNASASHPSSGVEMVSHIYLVAMALVLLHHMTKLKEGCAHCGRGLEALEVLGEVVAMPSFCLLAGVSDSKQPSAAAMRRLAFRTTLLFGLCLYAAYYSSLPERVHWFYRYNFFSVNKGQQKAPYREYFVMHTWFMVALPAWRLLHAAARSMGVERAMPTAGLLIHFGCWGNNCRWPLLRHPHDLEESVAAYGYFSGSRWLKSVAAALPQNDLSVIGPYTFFYATLPVCMPADFPANLPNPFRSLSKRLPQRLQRARHPAAARKLWIVGLLASLALFSDPAFRGVISKANWHSKRAYGCERSIFPPRPLVVRTDAVEPCGEAAAGGWSLDNLLLDATGVALSTVGVLGIAAVVPRHRTAWTEAGERTFAVYLLHIYVLPAVEVPFTALAQVLAQAVHPEAVAPAAFLGAIVLCRALALPILEFFQFASCLTIVGKGISRCSAFGRRVLPGRTAEVAPSEEQPLIG